MIGDDYLLKIGKASQDELVIGLSAHLYRVFIPTENKNFAEQLAAACAMFAIGETSTEQEQAEFLNQHEVRIRKELVKLSENNEICEILSGAAYNIGYGRYVESGGGRIINRFIGYIRADAQKGRDLQLFQKMRNNLYKINPAITRPIGRLNGLKIWSCRPYNPNEREYHLAIQRFRQTNMQDLDPEAFT